MKSYQADLENENEKNADINLIHTYFIPISGLKGQVQIANSFSGLILILCLCQRADHNSMSKVKFKPYSEINMSDFSKESLSLLAENFDCLKYQKYFYFGM